MISDELLHDYVIGSPTYVIRKKSLDGLDYHFNKHFHIIGDFDLNLRLAAKWKVNCVQDPVATARIHGQNVSLLHKNREIDELKIWHDKMKIDPTFSQKKSGLNQISLKINSRVLYVSGEESENQIKILISDSGKGIAKEDIKHIFDKFYRVSTGDVHNVKGFGLGLYYVKQMVQKHKGTIQAKSEIGKGTTFVLTFPTKQE